MTTLATFTIEDWMYDTLVADGAPLAGKTFNRIIPIGTVYPACVFEPISNRDILTANGTSVFNSALYLVKVVGKGNSLRALKTMADAVYTRLYRATGSNADGVVWTCIREEEIPLPPDIISGVPYFTLAQRFRIEAKAA